MLLIKAQIESNNLSGKPQPLSLMVNQTLTYLHPGIWEISFKEEEKDIRWLEIELEGEVTWIKKKRVK